MSISLSKLEKQISKLNCFPTFNVQDTDFPKTDTQIHWKPLVLNGSTRFCSSLAMFWLTKNTDLLQTIHDAVKDAFYGIKKFEIYVMNSQGVEGKPSGIKDYYQQWLYWLDTKDNEVKRMLNNPKLQKLFKKARK
jgi:hypothetical protein